MKAVECSRIDESNFDLGCGGQRSSFKMACLLTHAEGVKAAWLEPYAVLTPYLVNNEKGRCKVRQAFGGKRDIATAGTCKGQADLAA